MAAPPRDLLAAYRLGELSDFFAVPPGDTDTALSLERVPDRRGLVTALRAQADRFGAPDAARASLERLADPRSRTVVTGQQTGLLLGPNYTLSKAVTAIRLAERLDEPERPVVPVFWLASQDHDTAEVDHAWLLGLDERLVRIHVDLPQGAPTGAIGFDPAWGDVVGEALGRIEAPRVHVEEVLGLLRDAARQARTFADWFGAILARLLGPAGLVVIDPMDPDVAALARPVLDAELRDPGASSAAIRTAGERFRRQGFAPQLGRAEDATNLFLTEVDGDHPRRVLLRRADHGFRTDAQAYSAEDLAAIMDSDPTRVTPAAGLRPVTQDVILPTAATVVGPGELRYFAQLLGVYDLHGVPMPLIWPRASATVVEPPVRRILQTYGLDVGTYLNAPELHRERAILVRNDAWDRFADALAALDADARSLLAYVGRIDPTLERTVDRSRSTVERTVERLRSKAASALARRDQVTTRQFDRLGAHLLPRGTHQERVLSPFGHFVKFGIAPVMAAWLTLPEEGDHVLFL